MQNSCCQLSKTWTMIATMKMIKGRESEEDADGPRDDEDCEDEADEEYTSPSGANCVADVDAEDALVGHRGKSALARASLVTLAAHF